MNKTIVIRGSLFLVTERRELDIFLSVYRNLKVNCGN